jgi:hypothetical protein
VSAFAAAICSTCRLPFARRRSTSVARAAGRLRSEPATEEHSFECPRHALAWARTRLLA